MLSLRNPRESDKGALRETWQPPPFQSRPRTGQWRRSAQGKRTQDGAPTICERVSHRSSSTVESTRFRKVQNIPLDSAISMLSASFAEPGLVFLEQGTSTGNRDSSQGARGPHTDFRCQVRLPGLRVQTPSHAPEPLHKFQVFRDPAGAFPTSA